MLLMYTEHSSLAIPCSALPWASLYCASAYSETAALHALESTVCGINILYKDRVLLNPESPVKEGLTRIPHPLTCLLHL